MFSTFLSSLPWFNYSKAKASGTPIPSADGGCDIPLILHVSKEDTILMVQDAKDKLIKAQDDQAAFDAVAMAKQKADAVVAQQAVLDAIQPVQENLNTV